MWTNSADSVACHTAIIDAKNSLIITGKRNTGEWATRHDLKNGSRGDYLIALFGIRRAGTSVQKVQVAIHLTDHLYHGEKRISN
jgi:hypothetical protein